MVHVQQKLGVSERRACRVLTQPRSVQRHQSNKSGDEEALRRDIVRLASTYGRYGYRRITALLRAEGWVVNHKRVELIWREGVKVPQRQPKLSYDFVSRTSEWLLKSFNGKMRDEFLYREVWCTV